MANNQVNIIDHRFSLRFFKIRVVVQGEIITLSDGPQRM